MFCFCVSPHAFFVGCDCIVLLIAGRAGGRVGSAESIVAVGTDDGK